MLILSVCFDGRWCYAETPEEKSRLVAEVLDNLPYEGGRPFLNARPGRLVQPR
ncbi:hypothetical protein ACFYQA_21450 [Streptomyces sp. NPDC005774]|uniref:hypothetical protein n=1 Tax=Streptomyces sp. NPDC005774 TaxID=3364728 RepID=UPI0036BC93B5